MTKAIWILFDQLYTPHPALEKYGHEALIFCALTRSELDLKFAHKKRTAFILAAYRSYIESLKHKYPELRVIEALDVLGSNQIDEMTKASRALMIKEVVMVKPKDIDVREQLKNLPFIFTFLKDPNFISNEEDSLIWFNHKNLRMERFYQKMRQDTGILMEEGLPVGGRFNFDQANQQKLKQLPYIHQRVSFKKTEIVLQSLKDVDRFFPHHYGSLEDFHFSTTQAQALIELDDFIHNHLAEFGQYQDNIIIGEAYLHHSLLSAYINIGLLNPRTVIDHAQQAYHQKLAPIESVEGFIRQILGWREFMFYRYLIQMPQLKKDNALSAQEDLPSFYWDQNTKMRCMHNFVGDTLKHAYAHHIQRLMVGTNLGILLEIKPQALLEWYLGMYADAWPWVVIPNVMGMGLFADGGIIASKPYISSAAYMDKMSNACKGCVYDPKQLTGEKACPLNALYWHHIQKHQNRHQKNLRMSMMVSTYRKMNEEKKSAITAQILLIQDKLKQHQL